MVRSGEALNIPLVVTSTDFHQGDLPLAQSFASLSPDHVRFVALKKAQSGDGFIVRFVEVEGKASQARLELSGFPPGGDATATVVDLLERPVHGSTARFDGGVLEVAAPAYGVVTVLITP